MFMESKKKFLQQIEEILCHKEEIVSKYLFENHESSYYKAVFVRPYVKT